MLQAEKRTVSSINSTNARNADMNAPDGFPNAQNAGRSCDWIKLMGTDSSE